jgi:hypothetical protein
MSAGQELLPRCSLTERFAPLVFARVPLVDLMGRCPRGYERGWATLAANLPNHAFTIAGNYGCDGHKNPAANARFLPDLTIFRMNTCAKKVGGWGRLAQPILRQRCSLGLCCHHEGRPRGKACLAPNALRPEGSPVGVSRCRTSFILSVEGFTLPALLALSLEGSLVSTAQPRIGVQLHPRRGCATVRLKVPVTTSGEAAVPCAHI